MTDEEHLTRYAAQLIRTAREMRSTADNLSPKSDVYPASELRQWANSIAQVGQWMNTVAVQMSEKSSENFKVGDTVRLNGGGPIMTVIGHEWGFPKVAWFDASNNMLTGYIAEDAVIKAIP